MTSEKGVSVEVINARFVKPLDEQLILSSITKTGKVITVEENALQGGFGSAVLELLEQKKELSNIKIKRLGIPDKFIEHGAQDILYKNLGIDAEGIAKTILEMTAKNLYELGASGLG